MTIEKALMEDIDKLMPLYDHARQFMADNGNPNQWINGYPSREVIAGDINEGNCYVCHDEQGTIIGAFTFIIDADPTYLIIKEGAWLNESAPYGVIHRLASDGSRHGIGKSCIDWCFTKIGNIRIDTHRDNLIMQRLVTAYGFSYCGIIYTHNHTERLAYQLTK
jgi:RimJ/RimL family protein N-acetyltransferase